ncbi:MAG: hypothetical protein RLW68_00905 [Devosia marina]|uniref:hypothetical protein n=1 Tax=Devosia marina TaxID=2683198 RepID=UPI0032ED56B5
MSISASTLRKLAELRLDPDQMAGVLGILAEQQEAEEARKAAQRERTRKSRAKRDGNVTDTSQSQGSNAEVSPKKEIPPTPPKEKTTPSTTEPNGSSKTRAVRLTEDWELPVEWRQDALKAGLAADRIELEAEKMRDWSLSSPNGAKRNWRAAWRNWAKGAAEKQPRGSPFRSSPGKPRNIFEASSSLLTELMEAEHGTEPNQTGSRLEQNVRHLAIAQRER